MSVENYASGNALASLRMIDHYEPSEGGLKPGFFNAAEDVKKMVLESRVRLLLNGGTAVDSSRFSDVVLSMIEILGGEQVGPHEKIARLKNPSVDVSEVVFHHAHTTRENTESTNLVIKGTDGCVTRFATGENFAGSRQLKLGTIQRTVDTDSRDTPIHAGSVVGAVLTDVYKSYLAGKQQLPTQEPVPAQVIDYPRRRTVNVAAPAQVRRPIPA